MLVETKFLRLFHAVALGDRVNGWRVCWLGGWDKARIIFPGHGGAKDASVSLCADRGSGRCPRPRSQPVATSSPARREFEAGAWNACGYFPRHHGAWSEFAAHRLVAAIGPLPPTATRANDADSVLTSVFGNTKRVSGGPFRLQLVNNSVYQSSG